MGTASGSSEMLALLPATLGLVLLAPTPQGARALARSHEQRSPAPVLLADDEAASSEALSPALRQALEEMQERNARRGAVVLGLLLMVIVWLFSVPPDIRRSNICVDGQPASTSTSLWILDLARLSTTR